MTVVAAMLPNESQVLLCSSGPRVKVTVTAAGVISRLAPSNKDTDTVKVLVRGPGSSKKW